jgi:hypothetical protein
MTDQSDPLAKAIERLKDEVAKSLDPCLCATYIAITTKEVRDRFNAKREDYALKGVRCLCERGRADRHYVLFEFSCKPGHICLFDPSFLVKVNINPRYVCVYQDPYTHIPSTESRRSLTALHRPFPLTHLYWGLWLKTQLALWEVLCSPRLLDIEHFPEPRRFYPSMGLLETLESNTLQSDQLG